MAKQTGLGAAITVDDSAGTPQIITNSVTNYQHATPRAIQDVTGVDKSAYERLQLLADGTVTFNGVVDTGANMAHAVFKTVPTTSVSRTTVIVVAGLTLTMEMLYTDYAITRPASGELNWSANGVLSNGTAPAWT